MHINLNTHTNSLSSFYSQRIQYSPCTNAIPPIVYNNATEMNENREPPDWCRAPQEPIASGVYLRERLDTFIYVRLLEKNIAVWWRIKTIHDI